jgi:GSH-dependent disulfide-bond oxidoreductase
MIDLYFAPTSNGRRAAIALEECGLPYTLHRVTLGQEKPPALLAINPLGAIPALIDSDGPNGERYALTQSSAILLYAAEKSGKLMPKDLAGRARTYEWLMAAITDVGPTSSSIFYVHTKGTPEMQPAKQVFEERLAMFFANIEKRLGEVEYLAGDYSIADIALIPIWHGRKEMMLKRGPLPHLTRWGEAVHAREGVKKALAL